jgi:hypothetical protein
LLLAVAAGSYWLGTQKAISFPVAKPSQPALLPTKAVIATPTTDPTTGWKTYTNNKCRYTFKYPQNWVLQPENEKGVIGVTMLYPNQKAVETSLPLKIQIGCAEYQGNQITAIEEELEEEKRSSFTNVVPGVISREKIKINNYDVYRQVVKPDVGKQVLMYFVFDTNNYLLMGITPSENNFSREIDQILATFRFLE